jgi:dATP pyrophosphohydrolase
MNIRSDMIACFVVRPSQDRQTHELLQLRRAANDYLGGTWQIVRGTIEAGETAVQAAVRELREETGLVPKEFYRLGAVETFYIDVDDTLWHSVAFCAVVDRSQQITLNPEHSDFRWLPREQFLPNVMWASERSVLDSLFRDILHDGPGKPFLRIIL